MRQDKLFKQEMYAIERIVEFEERKNQRTKDMDFEHAKLIEQQNQLMKNIELLLNANK
jgi:hypothetical protein